MKQPEVLPMTYQEYDGPLIDVHTHFFPDRLWHAIMRWFERERQWTFPFSGTWEQGCEYLESLPRLERYVCCGYAHRPGIARDLNLFYAELQERFPKAVALGCAHQEDDDLQGLTREAFRVGLAGMKIHGQVQGVALDDPRWWPLYETVADLGGLLLVHAGTGPVAQPHLGFEHFQKVLRDFPSMRCVVAHLGCFQSPRFLQAALEHDNLYLDLAYTFLNNDDRRMDAPLDLLRAALHKVLFATDFPVIGHPYEDAVAAIAALPLSEEERQAVFFRNARRLLQDVAEAVAA